MIYEKKLVPKAKEFRIKGFLLGGREIKVKEATSKLREALFAGTDDILPCMLLRVPQVGSSVASIAPEVQDMQPGGNAMSPAPTGSAKGRFGVAATIIDVSYSIVRT